MYTYTDQRRSFDHSNQVTCLLPNSTQPAQPLIRNSVSLTLRKCTQPYRCLIDYYIDHTFLIFMISFVYLCAVFCFSAFLLYFILFYHIMFVCLHLFYIKGFYFAVMFYFIYVFVFCFINAGCSNSRFSSIWHYTLLITLYWILLYHLLLLVLITSHRTVHHTTPHTQSHTYIHTHTLSLPSSLSRIHLIHTRTHTHTHTYTHTYTYTYTHLHTDDGRHRHATAGARWSHGQQHRHIRQRKGFYRPNTTTCHA